MASIFTFEPDIPRVSSPWIRQLESLKDSDDGTAANSNDRTVARKVVSKLEAEPQEGPVEYKLHLLLRPRRTYSRVQRIPQLDAGDAARVHTPLGTNPSASTSSNSNQLTNPLTVQSRQHRLEQLTTQLLWRLQQSSSHHTSSASNVILPTLPESQTELRPPPRPSNLIKGLEESQGALYEIGVADDGTFVGLSEDEMSESLNNLRAMAACLGCEVEVLRMVPVGEAEWLEAQQSNGALASKAFKSRLVVAEALVKPVLSVDPGFESGEKHSEHIAGLAGDGTHSLTQCAEPQVSESRVQLRVSLAGATSSGKSSLLGTLTTSALDNARGKSRLAMLKHRHEITSGLTSSLSQELIGYDESEAGRVELVNYAVENVASWGDIHATTHNGRLVLLSDSAGHPRYRRTAVKGLVGWAPHWTVLCIPGNEEDSRGPSITPDRGNTAALSADCGYPLAYLNLCLRLGLPLVLAITKLDAASKLSLRTILADVLTLLKSWGRQPLILPSSKVSEYDDKQEVNAMAIDEASRIISRPDFATSTTVPIILTSAVQGTGIDMLHALLYKLPPPSSEQDEHSTSNNSLFYVEDVYTRLDANGTVIVSGHVRCGHISVGDELVLGPFSPESEDSEDSDNAKQRRPSSAPTSRSFPGSFKGLGSSPLHRTSSQAQQWRKIRVSSIRNLRLPVKSLGADQVGTIAFSTLSLDTPPKQDLSSSPSLGSNIAAARVRKGMVLLREPGMAATYITARFSRDDLGVLAVGSQAVVYIASIRASARVISASVPESAPPSPLIGRSATLTEAISTITLEDEAQLAAQVAGAVTHEMLLVTLAFETGREYVEVGAQVLVMPGSGATGENRGAGLEGFVGIVTEVS